MVFHTKSKIRCCLSAESTSSTPGITRLAALAPGTPYSAAGTRFQPENDECGDNPMLSATRSNLHVVMTFCSKRHEDQLVQSQRAVCADP